ncbi:DMT family transporter [Mangrovibrevibacter kandeliae]|uniref:DMT family transporter n=1 Tax=Mangrovibrevibacter kandeliae TaxID=2968473 RepID=UPI0021179D4F|nr:DMT family transporter [Aurantimonas sp. CSK15Z-1]MCQ8781105.1 DMT family transporter [Aurantimonas sp. CSK15Z-1]
MKKHQAVGRSVARPTLGIAFKVVSVLVFVGMQTSIKLAGEDIPAGEIVFFRSFFALIPVFAYLVWLGDLKGALKTDDFIGHLFRGLIGVTSMGLGFFALTRLPYPEFIAISYASPLLSVILAALLLKEIVRLYRWSAVVVGLLGILVVTVPDLSIGLGDLGTAESAGLLAALAGAAVSAVAMVQVRKLVHTETTATIVAYFSLTSTGIALLTIAFGWVMPSPQQCLFLVLSGLCGGVGQLLLTSAYRYADTSTVAPLEYTSLIFAIGIGFFLFDETVQITTLLGGAIVIGAGVFIIFREGRLGISRSKAKQVTPPQS